MNCNQEEHRNRDKSIGVKKSIETVKGDQTAVKKKIMY